MNITGIVTPASKSITPPALVPPITVGISTPITVSTATVAPPATPLGVTTVANVTNQVSYAGPPPLPGVTGTLSTGQQTVRRQPPPILDLIQQSLQNKAPSVHTVQYLTNSKTFNIPPPSFAVHSQARGKSPAVTASTPKKKNKNRGGRFLRKIVPLPQETSEDENSNSNYGGNANGAGNHDYETLGEESISEIEQAPADASDSSQEYIPVDQVAGLVEKAIQELLSEGVLVRANEIENDKTVVEVDLEQAEEIRNISDTIFQEQPATEAGEKEKPNKTNDEVISEMGEGANSKVGPKTRSRSKELKGPE